MPQLCKLFWIVSLLSAAFGAMAGGEQAPATIALAGYSTVARHGLMTFDAAGAIKPNVFRLDNPARVVMDFDRTVLKRALNQPPADHPMFANVRSAVRDHAGLRIVADLKQSASVKTARQGSQWIVELAPVAPAVTSSAGAVPAIKTASKPEPVRAETSKPNGEVKPVKVAVKTAPSKARDIVIAIDAGHGGKDVGAQGANGTQEKDVVFAIAKRLEAKINAQPGMRAAMVRKGDYFVKLKDRIRIAREAKADLLVSIHADAFNDPDAKGASVYTLSKRGASSAVARWLADSENASDGLGGVNLDDKDDVLASVLVDLSQTAAKEASQNVGTKVLKNFKTVGHLHRNTVQKAGFVVLKSPDIPSILVETAFISNPDEERKLRTTAHQDKIAYAVFNGIVAHFKQYAPANTMMAKNHAPKSAKTLVTESRSADNNRRSIDSTASTRVTVKTATALARQPLAVAREL